MWTDLLDPPWFYRVLWAVFKWFLKAKLRERIHLISKTDDAVTPRRGGHITLSLSTIDSPARPC